MSVDSPASDWPARWQLSAPESHVLRYRGSAYREEPFRLAVKELVARRVLRVERVDRRRLVDRRPMYGLFDGPLLRAPVEPLLAPVLDVYRQTRRRSLKVLREGSTLPIQEEGVLIKDLRKTARSQFRPIDRYRETHIAPALVARGLLEPTGRRGLRRHERYDWTAAGRKAETELDEWLALGRQNLPKWTASTPELSLAYANGAGAALLLADDLHPQLSELRRLDYIGPGAVDGGAVDFDFSDLGGGLGGLGDVGGFGGCGGGGGGGCGGGGCGGGGGGCGGGGGG